MNKLKPAKFPISTESLELLLAFQESNGLQNLSDVLAKDPSVISRRLQRLAEEMPVIEKVKGKWQINELGTTICHEAKAFLELLNRIQTENHKDVEIKDSLFRTDNPALVVVNAQKGLLNPQNGQRNNLAAEDRIVEILRLWRSKELPVFHVKHVSENPNSSFYKSSDGVEFIEGISPEGDELEIRKSKASSFSGTELQKQLREINCDEIILVGFTANECIDATARHASDLEFSTFVARDATAMFDFRNDDGKLFKADRVHNLTMANLDLLFAKVVETEDVLQAIS